MTLSPTPILPLLSVVLLHLAAYAPGRALLRRIRPGDSAERGAESLLHASLLGFTLLACTAFALAATRLLVPGLLWAVVAGLALWSGVLLVRWARHEPLTRAWGWLRRWTWADLPAVLAVAFLLSFLPVALSPILQQDDLVYHLFLPKLYLSHHRLVDVPWNLNANMPHLVEILYTLPMAMSDYTAPKLLSLSFTALTLLGLWSFSQRYAGRFAAGIVLLLYLSGKNVQWHLGIGHIEPVIGAYLLGATLAFETWMREGDGRGSLLVGLHCGFAAAAKYVAWFFAAAIVGALLFAAWRRKTLRREAALALGAMAVLVLPWLLKNAIYTGNPIFPNAYAWLGGKGWSEIQEIHYRLAMRTVQHAGPHWTLADLVRTPFRLTWTDAFYDCPNFSIALMLLFLIGLVAPLPPGGRWIAVIATIGVVSWALSVPQGRYLVAWVPVMTLVAALVLAQLRRHSPVWLAGLLVVVLGAGFYQLFAQQIPFASQWELLRAPRTELERRNSVYDLNQALNHMVPPGGRVLAIWENRFFFLERDFEADSVWQDPWVLSRLRRVDDATRFAAELRREGFTHVVLRPGGMASYFANNYAYDMTDPKIYPRARYERDEMLMKRFILDQLVFQQAFGEYRVFMLRNAPVSPGGS